MNLNVFHVFFFKILKGFLHVLSKILVVFSCFIWDNNDFFLNLIRNVFSWNFQDFYEFFHVLFKIFIRTCYFTVMIYLSPYNILITYTIKCAHFQEQQQQYFWLLDCLHEQAVKDSLIAPSDEKFSFKNYFNPFWSSYSFPDYSIGRTKEQFRKEPKSSHCTM